MNLSKSVNYNILIFLFLYFTLIIGFFLNEDFAGGANNDYNYHLGIVDFFLKDTIHALKNYTEVVAYHSPIFYIFLKYILHFGELNWKIYVFKYFFNCTNNYFFMFK